MNDNDDMLDNNSKRSAREGDDNRDKEANITMDIKNRMDKAVTERKVDGDSTRSDE